jgi:hypothetical protein
MLTILGFLAVVTNSAMVCFVGSARSELAKLDYNVDLMTKNVTAMTDTARMEGTFISRLNHAQLWWTFVILEHCVMLARVVIICAFCMAVY